MSYVPNGFRLTLPDGALAREERDIFSRKNSRNLRRLSQRKKVRRHGISRNRDADYPIVVHCHLCWDWVWQRPQQFVSRLSRRHKILFVETLGPDPHLSAPLARFHTPEEYPNITILRIQFPCWRWGDARFVDRERRRLVKEFLGGPAAGQFEHPVQWFYDPMAVTAFAGQLGEIATVYDCMDELSKFSEAPPEIKAREAQLLSLADVVFTGGHKLYEARRRSNPNCHFYGCGVDAAHFGKARLPQTAVPADLAGLRKPVFGYFGVVDERMDYELIAKLADANRGGSVVMVGPALKIKDRPVPRRPNLHWLGQRAYADLPAYAKGFDVCIMPFALNEATEYINPTKTLEYMATGKPVVSSAVPDVVRNFGAVASVAADHNDFIALCRRAAERPEASVLERGLQMAAENSWEFIVARLENHVGDALMKKRTTRRTA